MSQFHISPQTIGQSQAVVFANLRTRRTKDVIDTSGTVRYPHFMTKNPFITGMYYGPLY